MSEIYKMGVNRDPVAHHGLIFGENEATPSRKPLKHLPDLKTAINIKQITKELPINRPSGRYVTQHACRSLRFCSFLYLSCPISSGRPRALPSTPESSLYLQLADTTYESTISTPPAKATLKGSPPFQSLNTSWAHNPEVQPSDTSLESNNRAQTYVGHACYRAISELVLLLFVSSLIHVCRFGGLLVSNVSENRKHNMRRFHMICFGVVSFVAVGTSETLRIHIFQGFVEGVFVAC